MSGHGETLPELAAPSGGLFHRVIHSFCGKDAFFYGDNELAVSCEYCS